ncbi:MAG: glycosyltransferase 87 family protein [Acidobacteriaceae bacterium]
MHSQVRVNGFTAQGRLMCVAVARFQPRVETACCIALAALLLWKGIIPGWQHLRTDFPNYYLVARLIREGYSLDRIYDWIWLQRIKDHWGIDQPLVGFAGLTPFSALPLVPFSFFAALTAKRLWIAGNLLLLGVAVEALNKVTVIGRRRIWLLFLLCVFPLRTSFLLGQMHLLVLDLLVFAYVFNRKQWQMACATCLSIAGMLKIYPFLFAAYFLWKRKWTALLALLCATIVLLGLSILGLGPGIVHTYVAEILPRSLTGEILDPYSAQSGSMAALFHRLFLYEPQLNPSPLWNSPLLYSLLYPAWQAAVLVPLFALLTPQERDPDREQLEWAAFVFTLLLLSPVPASYHFVVMAFSMVLLTDFLLRRGEARLVTPALGLYCMMSLVAFLPAKVSPSGSVVLAFSRLWITMGFEALLLFSLWRHRVRRDRAWRLCPQTALLGAAAVILWTAGAFGYHRHFAQLSQDIQRRIPHLPSAYLSTALRKAGSGFVFTAMRAENYQVIDEAGRPIAHGRDKQTVDELSAATTKNASAVLIETANPGGSRLMITPGNQQRERTGLQSPPLVWDAESPALSSDGLTVAFIREVQGRGRLWIAPLQSPLGPLRSAPVPLTDAEYDVRNFAFAPSGWIVFAAKLSSGTSLFQLIPGGSPQELSPGLVDADYPAISPDERLIAFTTRYHNRWQLEYLDRKTGRRHTLTSGDCNAYSPQWMDARRLAYATDCGRGLGLTALASIVLEPGL